MINPMSSYTDCPWQRQWKEVSSVKLWGPQPSLTWTGQVKMLEYGFEPVPGLGMAAKPPVGIELGIKGTAAALTAILVLGLQRRLVRPQFPISAVGFRARKAVGTNLVWVHSLPLRASCLVRQSQTAGQHWRDAWHLVPLAPRVCRCRGGEIARNPAGFVLL